jgi:hypothetical protein
MAGVLWQPDGVSRLIFGAVYRLGLKAQLQMRAPAPSPTDQTAESARCSHHTGVKELELLVSILAGTLILLGDRPIQFFNPLRLILWIGICRDKSQIGVFTSALSFHAAFNHQHKT